jgi:hypothetical protein
LLKTCGLIERKKIVEKRYFFFPAEESDERVSEGFSLKEQKKISVSKHLNVSCYKGYGERT